MSASLDITIIILSYNTYDLTLQCLLALSKTDWGSLTKEIIVVDNASTDKTVERIKKKFSDVRVIKNSKNIGFAAGNNVGIREAEGRYILLLNSDTEVNPGTLKTMIEFMDTHPKAGASTCKLALPNGSMDPACHRGFPAPWAAFTYMSGLERLFPKTTLFGQYHLGYRPMSVPHEIDCPSGAFFLVRKEVIQAVGLLDEEFFMYGEDIDWAYRIKKQGWEIWFYSDGSIMHLKKQSGREHGDRQRRIQAQRNFLTTMKLFYQKHYEKTYGFVLTQLVYLGIGLKLLLFRIFGI
jgi:hypothetical protein